MNTLIFEQIIKELSIKYCMQDIDIINLLIKSAESVFNTSLQLSNKEGIVFLLKVSNNKRINLTQNTLKKISLIFENNLKDTNKIIQINSAKKLLKNRDIISFEILKKMDNYFICGFNNLISKLPFKNIPEPDMETFIIGTRHYGIIHSYSYSKDEIVLNCKHNLVEIKKASSILLDLEITRVNRFYGKRIKIYANEIPDKVIIKNLKIIYPKEKIIFFKDKNGN